MKTGNFVPHPFIRGGHLQTIVSLRYRDDRIWQTTKTIVGVSDGDQIVLHRDEPNCTEEIRGNVLLIHGLTGCHAAPYMMRHARDLLARGYRTFRMDLRGFGASRKLVGNISHAGRSDDVLAAVKQIAADTPDHESISAMGISLGGAQLLLGMGQVAAGEFSLEAKHRLRQVIAICPPIDLMQCAQHMQRLSLRPYNYYFIRSLLDRVPPRVRQREDYHRAIQGRRPRTLLEFDDRITSQLGGFKNASHYYEACSARPWLQRIGVPTRIVTTADDPIIPRKMFEQVRGELPQCVELLEPQNGGHNGFHSRDGQNWVAGLIADD
ncbi:MAG: alpha/beta fold hydrolase [Planctomycetota bacterium]